MAALIVRQCKIQLQSLLFMLIVLKAQLKRHLAYYRISMNSQTIGIALAVFSAITLGISNSLYKQSSLVLSPIQTTFYYYVFSALLASAVWLFYGESKHVVPSSLLWPAAIALFLFLSVLSFNFAIMHLSISVGATVRALSFVVTVMIGYTWHRDQVTWQQGLAVVFSLIAILLVGTDTSSSEKSW